MTHTYSVNDFQRFNERTKVLYKLATCAGFLVGIASVIIALIKKDLVIKYWGAPIALSAPTAIAVYFFLVRWVERDLWRNELVRLLLGITVPRVGGEYRGEVTSRYHSGKRIEENYEGTMSITQTWSTLLIEFLTENTISRSTGAFMNLGGRYVTLTLEYQVEPLTLKGEGAEARRHAGISTMRFVMKNGKPARPSIVHATYYTDHQQTGEIRLELVGD